MTKHASRGLALSLLLLAGCERSVMVRPVEGPRPAPRADSREANTYSGDTHVVQAGDTLYKISMQYGLDYRDIASWNAIAAPYVIYPRQELRLGPANVRPTTLASTRPSEHRERPSTASTRPAPAQARDPEAGQGAMTAPLEDPVDSSLPDRDSQHSVAQSATLSEQPLVLSEEPVPTVASPPRTTSPSGVAPVGTAATVAGSPVVATPMPPKPMTPPAPVAAPPPAARPAGGADIEPASASAAGWIWPTPGRVVVTYAGGDPTRQGIDIAGTLGQSVRVARDGEVVYSGAGLIGYGELIIVKHSSDLLSAYGHNRVRLVKEGEKLKAGQKIAEMGKNAANRVLLHFEVRKNGKPIDPMPLLPAR